MVSAEDAMNLVASFASAEDVEDPRVAELATWMLCADLYDDENRKVQSGINLVGNAENSRSYSQLIAKHLSETGADEDDLATWLADMEGAARYVRLGPFAPHVARGVFRTLRLKGLL